jgi:hypothetical protein
MHGAACLERDEIVVFACFQKNAVQIVPMRDGVGLLELLRKARVIERNAKDAFARERAAHFHGGRAMRVGQHGIAQAEAVERAEDVGPELDPGADLAEFRGLLEDVYGKALARDRMRGGKTRDASAGNQNGQRHRPTALTMRQSWLTDS